MKQTIIGFLFILKLCTARIPSLGERCNLNGEVAACTLYEDCSIASELYKNRGQLPQVCNPHKGGLVVCCAGVTPISRSLAKCQEYIANVTCNMEPLSTLPGNPLISTKNYPHVAKLFYKSDTTNDQKFFHDEGTLISARYVLTAAVSLNGYREYGYTKLVKVCFGMSDLLTNNASRIYYDIEETIAYPNYQSGKIYNNIGLIKLSEKVEFSEAVRPICLPDSDVKPSVIYRNYYDHLGITEMPLVTYKRRLVRKDACEMSYKELSGFIKKDDTLICTISTELDDSIYPYPVNGAPIVAIHSSVGCSNMLIGVSVERPSNYAPDAAANVFSFREWIEGIIWDGEE